MNVPLPKGYAAHPGLATYPDAGRIGYNLGRFASDANRA
jgi:hypothetical protein